MIYYPHKRSVQTIALRTIILKTKNVKGEEREAMFVFFSGEAVSAAATRAGEDRATTGEPGFESGEMVFLMAEGEPALSFSVLGAATGSSTHGSSMHTQYFLPSSKLSQSCHAEKIIRRVRSLK
jgi:hypothetical protein